MLATPSSDVKPKSVIQYKSIYVISAKLMTFHQCSVKKQKVKLFLGDCFHKNTNKVSTSRFEVDHQAVGKAGDDDDGSDDGGDDGGGDDDDGGDHQVAESAGTRIHL